MDGDVEGQPMPAAKSPASLTTADSAAAPGGLDKIKTGSCSLVDIMSFPGYNSAIFRRFQDLNLFNLLCLQSELVDLRDQLYTMGTSSSTDEFRALERENDILAWDCEAFRNMKSFFAVRNEAEFPGRRDKLLEIRHKLEEYNSALLKEVQLKALGAPAERDLLCLRDFLSARDPDDTTFIARHNSDLISLGKGSPYSSQFFTRLFLLWLEFSRFMRVIGKDDARDGSSFDGPVPAQVKEAQIVFNRLIMALFGGIALIGPTIIMTLHSSKNTCLITTSVATFIFAVVLAIFASDSSGKDVLGATAAYAAVLVVFIGTSLSAS